MYCAECGTANSTGAETCEICGSPLGPASGDRICHACGAPVGETDRFCRTCGQSQSGAEAARYEPGPSFVDDSTLQVDPLELPPWLREMTPSDFGTADGFPGAAAASVAQSDALPPWLDAAPPANGSTDSLTHEASAPWPSSESRTSGEQDTSFSLISEDDLPEWLRALGDQEIESEPAPPPLVTTTNGANHSAPPPTLMAPTISRAWLSRPRAVQDETAEEVAADFVPVEASARPEPIQAAIPPTAAPTAPVMAAPEKPATTVSPPPSESAKPAPRGMRLVLLSAIVVVIVIVAFYLLSSVL